MRGEDRESLVVEESIEINAPAAKVWQILTTPEFIKQWDDVPEDFKDASLRLESELVWKQGEGGFTKLTVVAFEPHKLLRLLWYVSKLELPPESYDIGYAYALSEKDGRTILSNTIGDWAELPDGENYYNASVEFAKEAAQKIKELAEQ